MHAYGVGDFWALRYRSGQLDGIVLEDQGKEGDQRDGHWWAVVAVFRKDMRYPFRFRGRYPITGANRAYGPEMAIKCAEVMALRRAFDVTALPVLEEMHDQPEWPRQVDTGRLRTPQPPPEPDLEDVGEGVEDDQLWPHVAPIPADPEPN